MPGKRAFCPRTRRQLSVALTACLLLCLATARAGAQGRLVAAVSNLVPDTLTLSPDGKRFAVVTVDPRTKLRRVLVDGKPAARPYDSIAEGMPQFSPDSQHLVFVAKLGQRCYVVLDGAESEGYLLARDGWPISDVAFSPHGRYLAYKARVEGKTVQVLNNERFGPYEVSLDAEGNRLWGVWDFTFSPDGEFFAYRAKVGGKMILCTGKVLADPQAKGNRLSVSPPYDSIGKETLVPVPGQGPGVFAFIACKGDKEYLALWNGKEVPVGKEHDGIARRSVVVPPHDPRRLDYYASKGDRLMAVIADKEEPVYDKLGPLMYAPDGRHAYVAQKGKSVMVVVQGTEGPPFEGVRYPGSVFSPDGRTVAYAAHTAKGEMMVVNGKPGQVYERVDGGSLVYSPDGKRLAYACEDKGKRFIVLDGKAGPEYDAVAGLRFSPDSSCLFYRGRKGLDVSFVLEDQPLGPFADVSPDSPVFSPDGKHLAYAILKDGQWRVVHDDKEGPPCDGIASRLSFSNDGGNHLAYVARFEDSGKPAFAVVADGKSGKRYDAIWLNDGGRLVLDRAAPGYFARKGLLIYREAITWP